MTLSAFPGKFPEAKKSIFLIFGILPELQTGHRENVL